MLYTSNPNFHRPDILCLLVNALCVNRAMTADCPGAAQHAQAELACNCLFLTSLVLYNLRASHSHSTDLDHVVHISFDLELGSMVKIRASRVDGFPYRHGEAPSGKAELSTHSPHA